MKFDLLTLSLKFPLTFEPIPQGLLTVLLYRLERLEDFRIRKGAPSVKNSSGKVRIVKKS
jgi:hypothetical protein